MELADFLYHILKYDDRKDNNNDNNKTFGNSYTQQIFQYSSDPILIYNNKTHQSLAFNQAFSQLFQLTSYSNIGFSNITPTLQNDGNNSMLFLDKQLKKTIETQEAVSFKFIYKCKQNKLFTAVTAIVPNEQDANEFTFIFQEIKYLQTKKEILSIDRYKNIIDTLPHGICIFNTANECLYLSEKIFGDLGINETNICDCFSDKAAFSVFLKRSIQSPQTEVFELKHKKGHLINVEIFSKYHPAESEIVLTIQDVTERTNTIKDLTTNKTLLQSLFDNSFDGLELVEIVEKNNIAINTIPIMDNGIHYKILGYTQEEVKNIKSILDISPTYQEDNVLSKDKVLEINKQLLSQKNYQCHWQFTHKKGHTIYTEASMISIQLNGKKYMFTIWRNITEKEQTKIKLKQKDILYEHLFEHAYDGLEVSLLDINTHKTLFTQYNQKFWDLHGTNKDASYDKLPFLHYATKIQTDGRTAQEVFKENKQQLNEHNKTSFEWQIYNKNKQTLDLYISAYKIPLDRDKVAIVSVFKDITKIKQTQRDLSIREHLFRKMLETGFDGIEILKKDPIKNRTITVERNEKMRQLFGRTDQELEEAQNLLYLSPDFQANGQSTKDYLNETRKTFNQQGFLYTDWQIKRKDDTLIDLTLITTQIELYEKIYQVSFFKDITKQKKQTALIAKQIEKLHNKNQELLKYIESNNQLENFAYIASHDLQAPLRTIEKFTEILQKSLHNRLTSTETECMDFIVASTQNMQALIKGILAYSRADSNKISKKSFRLTTLLHTIIQELKSDIEDEKAEIILENIPSTIYADELKTKQIFQNLISNALKFVKPNIKPSIRINYQEQETHWQFSIEDNGIGIEEVYQEKIFLLFKRLHSQSDYLGTGIGLALVKKLVDQHNGQIWLESTLDKGTTFYFTIEKQ